MAERYFTHPNPPSLLPSPERSAYFPEISLENKALQGEIIERVGSDNLVYAIQYGSLVGGGVFYDCTHGVWRVCRI